MTKNWIVALAAMSLLAFNACGDDEKDPVDPKVECTSNNDCDANEKCSADGVCVADVVVDPECTSNEDCATGEKCQSGVCVADTTTGGCTSNEDCATGETCEDGACVPETTPTWTCPEEWYGDDSCDCGCGIIDSDCDDASADSCDYTDACLEQSMLPKSDENWLCVGGAWICDDLFGESMQGDGACDCGCGVVDSDCDDASADSCEYSDLCSALGMEPHPTENWHCVAPALEPCTEAGAEKYDCIEYDLGADYGLPGFYFIDVSMQLVCDGSEYVPNNSSMVECSNGCDAGKCILLDEREGQSCTKETFQETCGGTGDVVLWCDVEDGATAGVVAAFKCSESSSCEVMADDNYANCYAPADACSESDNTKQGCGTSDYEGYLLEYGCFEMVSGEYYWEPINLIEECEGQCVEDACLEVAEGWTCSGAWYGDGDCDCGCGIVDMDCADASIASCKYGSDCGGLSLVDPSDTTQCIELEIPDGWNTACSYQSGTSWYGDGSCDCGCGALDVDCDDETAASCEEDWCADLGYTSAVASQNWLCE
ncbi:MAG: hypothetical protein LBM75_10855 [Myxococcales bacterium]|jgi:hypothetical protein|nr:hypothetical protein [Myxococcales bacterium]